MEEHPQMGNVAWQTVIGTLGGVALTALFSLLTAYHTHRWQLQRSTAENVRTIDRELRTVRRETYAKYIASAQDVFQISMTHYIANRSRPLNPADVALAPPEDLRLAIIANEALRVEAVLLAGPSTRSAIDKYGRTLKHLWLHAASGTEFTPEASTSAYHQLITTMHDEITDA
jgi:hypothetical protein